ncbi:hypothetical protein [Bartonella sp. DGB2]|uniref:hypothetical protein n=1 Tax=Bartonella sp. DGB2 TaxID=3388426 RepID=UPI0039902FDB
MNASRREHKKGAALLSWVLLFVASFTFFFSTFSSEISGELGGQSMSAVHDDENGHSYGSMAIFEVVRARWPSHAYTHTGNVQESTSVLHQGSAVFQRQHVRISLFTNLWESAWRGAYVFFGKGSKVFLFLPFLMIGATTLYIWVYVLGALCFSICLSSFQRLCISQPRLRGPPVFSDSF